MDEETLDFIQRSTYRQRVLKSLEDDVLMPKLLFVFVVLIDNFLIIVFVKISIFYHYFYFSK